MDLAWPDLPGQAKTEGARLLPQWGVLRFGGSLMITAQQCRDYSANCLTLGTKPNLSVQRGTVLLAMARSWTALANQRDRYDAIMIEEGK